MTVPGSYSGRGTVPSSASGGTPVSTSTMCRSHHRASSTASEGSSPSTETCGIPGRRAATAVDNARLFEERSHIARTLQHSLLPPQLPDIPGIEIAARYRPTGEGNEVGGDFYDLFETAEGDWAIVVGDVCGKGADAAALTGLSRHTIRAAAMQHRNPSTVLEMLNGKQPACEECCGTGKCGTCAGTGVVADEIRMAA